MSATALSPSSSATAAARLDPDAEGADQLGPQGHDEGREGMSCRSRSSSSVQIEGTAPTASEGIFPTRSDLNPHGSSTKKQTVPLGSNLEYPTSTRNPNTRVVDYIRYTNMALCIALSVPTPIMREATKTRLSFVPRMAAQSRCVRAM